MTSLKTKAKNLILNNDTIALDEEDLNGWLNADLSNKENIKKS